MGSRRWLRLHRSRKNGLPFPHAQILRAPVTPDDWKSLLAAGQLAVQRGDAQAAISALRGASELEPGAREVRYWLANALRMAGRTAEGEVLLRGLLAEQPADPEVVFALAWLLREQGRPADAADALTALARAPGMDIPRLMQVAGFLRDSNCFDEAIEVLQRGLDRQPEDPAMAFRLARLYQAIGRFEPAIATLRRVVDRDPSIGGAWLSLAQLQRFDDLSHPDLVRLMAAADRPLEPEAHMCVSFALGKAYDDLGRWDDAWAHYGQGNRLRRDMEPWDRAGWHRRCDALLAQPVDLPNESRSSARHPVYVVGMLRSGTTLVEALLDRHPRITGRGELNHVAHQAAILGRGRANRRAAAESLWTHLRLDGPEDGWYIDKNPLNFRYLGFIAQTLPEARVLHVARDGRDACLSCYFQLFQHPDAGFANDLGDLVDYYATYRRLMRWWETNMADRMLTLNYEDLVTEPRPVLRRALSFLGLEWSDALDSPASSGRPIRTASAWQARQAPHRESLARWRHYRDYAPDFFDAIAALDAR